MVAKAVSEVVDLMIVGQISSLEEAKEIEFIAKVVVTGRKVRQLHNDYVMRLIDEATDNIE